MPILRVVRDWLRRVWSGLIVGGFFVAILTIGGMFVLNAWQQYQSRQELITTFVADIKAMKAREAQRLITWGPHMERLEKFNFDKEEARAWLMPDAIESNRFPVFEENTSRLGMLNSELAEKILKFYYLSGKLRAEIRILTGPNIIMAATDDKVWLIEENEKTQKEWDAAADALLDELRKVR